MKKERKAMTVQELINFLQKVKDKDRTYMAVALDTEEEGFSLIPDDVFHSVGFMENKLGYNTLEDEPFEDNYVPVIVLWGSND